MRRPSLTTVSLVLNAILFVALLIREGQHMLLRFQVESEAPSWAKYAGAMQAVADYGNGVRRFYRPTLAKDTATKSGFTGQVDQGAQVWTWTYFESLGEASRLSAIAYTDMYNARMLNFIKDPAAYGRNGVAATQPAD